MVFSTTILVNYVVLALLSRLTLQAVLSIPLERVELPHTHTSYNISGRSQTYNFFVLSTGYHCINVLHRVGPTSVIPLTRTAALLWVGDIQIGTGAAQKIFRGMPFYTI